MKSNVQRKNHLIVLNNYFKHINNLAPFPIIDTEIIMNLDNKIKMNEIDYDDDPVVCCAHCKSLAIYIDEDDNDVCPLCKNSLNEVETHRTIYHYLNKYKDKW